MNDILAIVSFMYNIIIIVFIPIDENIFVIKIQVGDFLSGVNPRYENFPFEI